MRQSLEQIAARICRLTGYTLDDLRSKARNRDIVVARQLFCYFAHESGYSYSEIGRYVNRDHATVRYSYLTVVSMKDTDPVFKQLINEYYMSRKIQMLELRVPEYDNDSEKKHYSGFTCPRCNGNGWIKDWGAKRDDPAIIGCTRCGGSGLIKAEVTIQWSAEEKIKKEE